MKNKTSKVRGLQQAFKDDKVQLPIVFHEREIMENIENNIVTIVCGETGSGKSTQIPQFIIRAAQTMNYKYRSSSSDQQQPILIGVTQPRRVAAVSLAKRVSEEMGTQLGHQVGY